MDERPPEDQPPKPEEAGVIGEIEPQQPDSTPPETPEEPRARRRRPWTVGCLLALLGALAGGGIAILLSRGAAPPGDAGAPIAPGPETVNSLVFSPTPERPPVTPDIIPAETDVIYGFYQLGRVPAGAELSGKWSHEGQPLGDLPLDEHQPESGPPFASGRFTLRPPPGAENGFTPGIYEVELTAVAYPEVVVQGSFVALPRAAAILQGGGEPGGPPAIQSLRLAQDVTDAGEPVGESTVFAADSDRIHAIFSFEGIMPGSVVMVRWYFGEQELTHARAEIPLVAEQGWGEAWLDPGDGSNLPEGDYLVSVHLGDEQEPLASMGFLVTSAAGAAATASPGDD